MTDGEQDETHELRSFGRRRGRKPSERQLALMHEVLPRVAVDLCSPPPCGEGQGVGGIRDSESWVSPPPGLPHKWGGECWLEIGFGGGEHLVWQAQHNPNVTIIGCEPFEDGVIKVLTKIDGEKIGNIRLHMGDARDVLRWLSDDSIARAFVLFPDPWPKKKHRKRRLVNSNTLALLARVMKPGAELRIGTDIGDYARTILQAFSTQREFVWLAEGPNDWRIRPPDWPETRYEQKAEQEGRRRYYLRFLRT